MRLVSWCDECGAELTAHECDLRLVEREVDEYRAERTERDAEMEAEESAEQEERG